ncbi:pseudaminic acid synthase [bacterium]|nr:pseudaminic acid synthase [bacterium]
MKPIVIDDQRISDSCAPYIIAEMSGNHDGSFEKAIKIIEIAADIGVHAVKIQTYTAETMTLNLKKNEFLISDSDSLWNGKSLYELYQQAHTPWEWHEPIFKRCRELGLTVFSTPFDESAIDFLEKLQAPAYKIASFENTDLPLIRRVAATGKPMLISTGMATLAELDETVREAKKYGCNDLILLKCTSTYPALARDSNILTIPHMQKLFCTQVGLSDHTLGIGVPLAAVALGATVIEKHLTLSRKDEGVDSAFSLEPDEMKRLVIESEQVWSSLGGIHYGPTEKEKGSLQFRRSIYVIKSINEGDVLTRENIRCIRPGLGLPPKFFEGILGKRVNCEIKLGTPLSWDHIG